MSRRDERAAADLLERVLGARLEARDVPGAAPSTHDYAIVRPDGPPGAFEITSLNDEDQLRLQARMTKHGVVVDAESLSWAWWVELRPEARLEPYKKVPDRIVRALERLEAAGVDKPYSRRGNPPGDLAGLSELPIDFAGVTSKNGPGGVVVLPHSRGSTPSNEHVTAAVETALSGERLSGERDKLRRSGAEERHLLLWVDTSLFDVWVGLCHDAPPDVTPTLPPEITDLWVAAPCPEGTVVWHTSGARWDSRRIPD